MRLIPRRLEGSPEGRRLLSGSGSGAGRPELDHEGRPWRVWPPLIDGGDVGFVPRETEARRD